MHSSVHKSQQWSFLCVQPEEVYAIRKSNFEIVLSLPFKESRIEKPYVLMFLGFLQEVVGSRPL